ncbi:hypothetical protein AVEN_240161-1 [Araneus ventricosus]|uniref:Uncharacterized protein n=1 Tax=Araneus ventricosus TaxID=182803 RepID=A0A4Y2KVJ6_ARAVE|nr:hypothetical protein AVEN_240161-1 [Araneus ventricosus]
MTYFHTAGHICYARCAHLYVQQTEELKEKLDSTEYKKFSEGYFTIRRKDRVWSRVAPDMIIEQCLMRSVKIAGGVTQGRGIADSTLSG